MNPIPDQPWSHALATLKTLLEHSHLKSSKPEKDLLHTVQTALMLEQSNWAFDSGPLQLALQRYLDCNAQTWTLNAYYHRDIKTYRATSQSSSSSLHIQETANASQPAKALALLVIQIWHHILAARADRLE